MTKVAVLGLDGVPYTFLNKMFSQGHLPNLRQLFKKGFFKKMMSTIPPVSSVAWTSFSTGKNPGEHGIYGFIDKDPGSDEIYVPLANDIKAKTLWEKLSEAGKRVVVLNVPLTYPPYKVNGILVGCFLCPDINKLAYPTSINKKLKSLGYRIDVDAKKIREGKKQEYFDDLNLTLKKRFETAFYFLEREQWDYFHLHVMETDRINHFLWADYEKGNNRNAAFFMEYYKKIDSYAGEFISKLAKDTVLICLSDHGFCTVKKEVQLNYYLYQTGWLKLKKEPVQNLGDMADDSKAYSLIPGRIYITQARYKGAIAADLLKLRDEESGSQVIKAVYSREEIYQGRESDRAPDLVALPCNGYDLKGKIDAERLFEKSALSGMHTYDDAFVFSDKIDFKEEKLDISQIAAYILRVGN